MANNGAALNAAASGSTIRVSNSDIYNKTTGVFIASGATIQSDGTNKHGNNVVNSSSTNCAGRPWVKPHRR